MASEPLLPSFERPPLNEVVLSVQFDPITNLNPAVLGLLWATFRKNFPTVQCHPPLDPVVERMGIVPRDDERPVFVENYPPPRLWFLNSIGNELIQVQQDRFIRNWRQLKDSDTYPRYDEHIRPCFLSDYGRFLSFLQTEGIADPVPNQCEVTYVNVIQPGEVWSNHADLSKVLKLCRPEVPGVKGLVFEDGRLALRHRIHDTKGAFLGRLHIAVEPQLKRSDKSPVIALRFTARGQPIGQGADGVLNFFNLGRETIVNTFAAITTSEMHILWGRINVQ